MTQERPTTEEKRIVFKQVEAPIKQLATSEDVESDLGPQKPEKKEDEKDKKGGES